MPAGQRGHIPPPRVAVILVAGIGSRLRPLTDDRPKALVDVGSETILGRAIRLLVERGVERIVLATGYREDRVREAVLGLPVAVEFCRNERFDSTQNSVSLALCARAVGGEGFYKLDGDVIFHRDVLARLDASQVELAVAVDSSRRADAEAMKVRLGASKRIVEFGKSISLEHAHGESIGIERVLPGAAKPLFEALERAGREGRLDAYYEDIYSGLLAAGSVEAEAIEVGDLPWTEVDDGVDLERARQLVREI